MTSSSRLQCVSLTDHYLAVAKIVYDCHVTAICSEKNVPYVNSLSADSIVDYTTQSVPQSLLSSLKDDAKYDLIVDCVGGTELIPFYVRIQTIIFVLQIQTIC
mgnify:CR=1 FL=1